MEHDKSTLNVCPPEDKVQSLIGRHVILASVFDRRQSPLYRCVELGSDGEMKIKEWGPSVVTFFKWLIISAIIITASNGSRLEVLIKLSRLLWPKQENHRVGHDHISPSTARDAPEYAQRGVA
jgi:hypothetical protein